MEVSTRPKDDLYHVYIAYEEVGPDASAAQVGKILFINVLDTSSAYSYGTIYDDVETKSGAIQRTITNFKTDGKSYIFGGKTNYLEDPDIKYLGLDWTDTNKHYGYF